MKETASKTIVYTIDEPLAAFENSIAVLIESATWLDDPGVFYQSLDGFVYGIPIGHSDSTLDVYSACVMMYYNYIHRSSTDPSDCPLDEPTFEFVVEVLTELETIFSRYAKDNNLTFIHDVRFQRAIVCLHEVPCKGPFVTGYGGMILSSDRKNVPNYYIPSEELDFDVPF